MDPNDPRWLEHLDILTTWGEASAANQTPPPTDEALWAASRIRPDLDLPEHIDQLLLIDLREAFNKGRKPTRIDMHAVADAVNARGVHVQVLHSSGNTATLYTGEEALDVYGDVRFTASAGPGYFEAPGRREPFADTDDFRVGPHDESWTIGVPEYATTEQIADLIVAVTAEADAQQDRFAATVAAARAAMWTAMSAAYPHAETTDLPPSLDDAVVAELRRLLARWLDRHWPAFDAVPEHLAAVTGSTDTAVGDEPG